MSVFFILVAKLLPFYVLILVGFLAGKRLQLQKETIARALIYTVTPVVVFTGVATAQLSSSMLLLPVVMFVLCGIIASTGFAIGKFFWKDSTRNLLFAAIGNGNTGYFGLPVGVAVLGETAFPVIILCGLGVILFENTFGFYMTARGQHTVGEAFQKLLKLPALYAFISGLVVNFTGISFSDQVMQFLTLFRAAYTIFGMMLIGIALTGIQRYAFDLPFVLATFLGRFVAWPLAVGTLIFLDTRFGPIFSPLIHQVAFLLSLVPLAANTVAYATELNVQPEKAALTVLLSTLFALLYIPLMVMLVL